MPTTPTVLGEELVRNVTFLVNKVRIQASPSKPNWVTPSLRRHEEGTHKSLNTYRFLTLGN